MPAIDRKAADRRYYFNKKLRATGEVVQTKTGRPPHTESEKRILIPVRFPVSVIGHIQRMVNEAVAVGAYPWKTQTAMINALVMRGLETLKGDAQVEEALAYFRAIHQMEEVSRHRKESHAAMSLLKSEISALISINAIEEAAAVYQSTHEAILGISQNVWRDWMLHQMEKAYPRLAAMKPQRISLTSKTRSKSQTDAGQRRRHRIVEEG